MSRFAALCLAALAACAHAGTADTAQRAGQTSGIAGFARHAQFTSAKISPKGTFVAALSQESGRRTLAFINLVTRKLTFVLRPEGESTIGRFYWANDERVVIEMVDQQGTLAAPVTLGEMYAIDALVPRSSRGRCGCRRRCC